MIDLTDPWAVHTVALCKTFGGRQVIDNLSLEIAQGELFGFLGPNGAGKTTTLKILMGLLNPSGGKAEIRGFNVVTQSQQAKAIAGYVPDHAALYDKLTGIEMLKFVADLYKIPRSKRDQQIPALLRAVALHEHGDALIQSYSRGMRQKLSLCAALIHDPQVLFLDEPTVGLDPSGVRQLKDVLRHLCTTGRTVFLSTHVLNVAEFLCDRVGIVVAGKLIAVGTPEELRASAQASSLEAAFLHFTGDDESAITALRDAVY